MLPFLQPRKSSTVIQATTKPEGGVEDKGEEGENPDLMSAAEDLIRAVHAKDAKGVADALEAAMAVQSNPSDDFLSGDEGAE